MGTPDHSPASRRRTLVSQRTFSAAPGKKNTIPIANSVARTIRTTP
jgi:hypothetical protein